MAFKDPSNSKDSMTYDPMIIIHFLFCSSLVDKFLDPSMKTFLFN